MHKVILTISARYLPLWLLLSLGEVSEGSGLSVTTGNPTQCGGSVPRSQATAASWVRREHLLWNHVASQGLCDLE